MGLLLLNAWNRATLKEVDDLILTFSLNTVKNEAPKTSEWINFNFCSNMLK